MKSVMNIRYRNVLVLAVVVIVMIIILKFSVGPARHMTKRKNLKVEDKPSLVISANGLQGKKEKFGNSAVKMNKNISPVPSVDDLPVTDYGAGDTSERTGEEKKGQNFIQRVWNNIGLGGDKQKESLEDFQAQLSQQPINEPPRNEFNDKWIVVTTINKPTDDVRSLAAIKGWNIVVVADTKTPEDYDTLYKHDKNAFFLSVAKQKESAFSVKDHIPFKVYGRKNLGYLFAIQRGAKVIYETDDDNHPTDNMRSFYPDATTYTGLVVDTNILNFNVYPHFGQSSQWPRGFQLDYISKPIPHYYKLCSMRPPAVQQGVVNGDPDMDAVYRLSRKIESRIINVTFDYASPPVTLPNQVYCPYNSQNTLSRYAAFWGLLLPNTVTFRVTDIWRSYFTTCLLGLIGERVAYSPPSAFQLRSAHSYLKDMSEEPDLYFKTEALVKFLKTWTCDPSLAFRDCVVKLARDMATHESKFWGEADVRFIMAWVSDLVRIGYKFPKRVLVNSTFPTECENTRVLYYPREQKTSFPSTTHNELIPSTSHVAREALMLTELCPTLSVAIGTIALSDMYTSLYSASKVSMEDMLLIVRVHNTHTGHLEALDTFYRRDFYQMLYCVEEKSFEAVSKLNRTVVTIPNDSGPLQDFKCLTTAVLMNYRVSGYLFMNSGTLFRYWELPEVPKEKIWIDKKAAAALPEVNLPTDGACNSSTLKDPNSAKSFQPFSVLYLPQRQAELTVNIRTRFSDVSKMRSNFYIAVACQYHKNSAGVKLVDKREPTQLPTTPAPLASQNRRKGQNQNNPEQQHPVSNTGSRQQMSRQREMGKGQNGVIGQNQDNTQYKQQGVAGAQGKQLPPSQSRQQIIYQNVGKKQVVSEDRAVKQDINQGRKVLQGASQGQGVPQSASQSRGVPQGASKSLGVKQPVYQDGERKELASRDQAVKRGLSYDQVTKQGASLGQATKTKQGASDDQQGKEVIKPSMASRQNVSQGKEQALPSSASQQLRPVVQNKLVSSSQDTKPQQQKLQAGTLAISNSEKNRMSRTSRQLLSVENKETLFGFYEDFNFHEVKSVTKLNQLYCFLIHSTANRK